MASEIRVVKLGQFAGGSFGVPGHPHDALMMWAVQCPRRPLEPGTLPRQGFVFASEAEALRFAEEERSRERRQDAERKRRALAEARHAARIEELRRGWDGYQFVGEEEGRRKADALLAASSEA